MSVSFVRRSKKSMFYVVSCVIGLVWAVGFYLHNDRETSLMTSKSLLFDVVKYHQDKALKVGLSGKTKNDLSVLSDAFDYIGTLNGSNKVLDRSTQASFVNYVGTLNGSNKVLDRSKQTSFVNKAGKATRATDPAVSDDDVEAALEKRRNFVMSTCQMTGGLHTVFNQRSLVSTQHRFVYCPVEKTASTFWRRFFYQLVYTDPIRSPFDVSVNKALAEDFLKYKSNSYDSIKSFTKLLYVRDPYSRLFSAYVDKLISPNPYYWKVWGQPAVRRYRKYVSSQKQSKCGDDVTFSEFVSFALDVGWRQDVHIMPIEQLCTPCSYNYTVIGKIETFLRDASYVLKRLGIPQEQIGFDRMENDAVYDAVEDSSKDSLSADWLSTSLRCISKEDVAKRILRKLQIRGFISWRYTFDMSAEELDKLNSNKYVKILMQSRTVFMNKTELKIQKKQAYREACKTLDSSQIDKIRKLYAIDFKMFQYDDRPSHLSDDYLNSIKDTKAFDWTKPWDLSQVL